MADILSHPSIGDYATEEIFNFPDGSSVTLKSGEGKHLTASLGVYLCSDVIYQIHRMMRTEQ